MTVFCSSCGVANKAASQFCSGCGETINSQQQAQAPIQPVVQQAPVQQVAPQPIIVNVQQQQQQQGMGVRVLQADVTSIWMLIWCLIIPFLGIVWWALNKNVKPNASKNYLYASLVNLFLAMIGGI